ncbi:MAG: SigE family RNA polymerase sigma factor [Acidothermus sp.]|nr:SigE family RNA polymerase sigma factor [Acidothermus sp.]
MDDGAASEFRGYVAARSAALLRTAYLLTGNHADAEDLLQTALAKTYLAWRTIRDPGAVDAYVHRVLVNTRTSWWRRRRHLTEIATDEVPERPRETDLGEHVAVRDALWTAVLALPRKQRAVIVLRYYEDLSEAETARILGISVGTVKSTTAKALAKLREAVGLRDDSAPAEINGGAHR